jgi:hypothetical protein
MATSLKDTTRATAMTGIVTAITATSRIKCYTGTAPSKTAAPTGTILTTLTPSATFGTVSSGVLTANSIANDTSAANSGTPGYYRVIDGTTDDGTHTQVQGPCNIPATGTGNVTATAGSNTLTFASSQSSLAGTFIQVTGDSSNGSYLITNGATTTWYIGAPYAGSSTTTWTSTTQAAGLSFASAISQNGTVSITSLVYTEGNA